MFFATFKLKRAVIAVFVCFTVCIFLLISGFISSCDDISKNADTFEERIDIAAIYGFDISSSEQKCTQIDLSEVTSEFFEDYNSLQKICNFDLSEYSDKIVLRYSYLIDNGRYEVGLLTFEGRLIGGDVFSLGEGEYLSLTLKNGEDNGNDQN